MKDAQAPIADAARAITTCLNTLDATLAKLAIAYRERGDEEESAGPHYTKLMQTHYVALLENRERLLREMAKRKRRGTKT